MTYAGLLRSLYAARRFGVRFELGRVEAALAALGHPERRLGAVLHVGGTNGKGSTAAMAEAALRASGYRTGLYTSPHLSRFTERIRIGGAEIDGDRLAAIYGAHHDVIAPFTFFEQATLLALLAFAEARVDVSVLEVGLGGRLDATNVVEAEVAVVTGVALDHQEHLGDDLASIAREKAGIWKRGRVAVIGAGGEAAAIPVLEREARRHGVAELVRADTRPPAGTKLGLVGPHQQPNAACAIAGLAALARATGGRIAATPAAIADGLASVRWPGRCEEVRASPRVWLDAAHNPDGARALGVALDAAGVTGRILAVIGVSSDKDVPALIAPVVARAAAVWATQAPSPRALAAAELARAASTAGAPRVIVEPDPHAALAAAVGAAGAGDLVIACGSIFLVGPLRARLLGEAEDPVSAQDPVR